MGTLLLIDLHDASGWLLREQAGASWRPGLPVPPGATVAVVAPAQDVALHRAELPARRTGELRQAVPYAIEDRLAEPVEQLQFALGARAGAAVEVAVVARRTLAAWLERLQALGLSPDHLYADAQLLPRSAESLHVAQVDGRVLIAGVDGAYAIDAADWPAWRSRLPALPLEVLQSDGRFVRTDTLAAIDRRAFLRYAAGRAVAAAAPDLLQGEFAPRRRSAGRQRLWRWAAMLAALAIALVLADAAIGVLAERQRREALRAQMAEVFRQALPEARMTADPAAQFASELARMRRSGSAGGPFALLGEAAPLITQGSRYRLEAMDWRLGVLELDVATADVASLDALREALATRPGLSVEVTGVSPGDGGVRGRLRVRGAGA